MPRYLCLQRTLSVGAPAKPSPAQMQAMYDQFRSWQEKYAANLVDMGGKLGAGQLVTNAPASDGPFVEVKELVGGYMIVSAATLDDAIDIARGCPGLVSSNSGVEVVEIRSQ